MKRGYASVVLSKLLGAKVRDHLIFIELLRENDLLRLAREWYRMPHNDRTYNLHGTHKRYYGMKQPTSLEGMIREAIRQSLINSR